MRQCLDTTGEGRSMGGVPSDDSGGDEGAPG